MSAVGRRRTIALEVLLAVLATAWLFPILWAAFTSLRPYADTALRGYVSLPGTLTLDNYATAMQAANLPHFILNTLFIVVPAVAITLALSLVAAYAIGRFSWRFNITGLLVLTAGNLLPPQVLIAPLFRLSLAVPVPAPLSDNGVAYDQGIALVVVHVAIQLGFCTFVLSNFIRTIPRELTEAALMDGASAWQQLHRIVMPLTRAPLAALATLEFTFLYNDFFWALFLMRTGDKRPVTSALAGLQGEFFRDANLLAAGAILIALPPLVVHLLLQRQLFRGLALTAE